ncbi:TPA: hypothetical protein ACLKPQ_003683, partial [Klebsiella pneumoniae]
MTDITELAQSHELLIANGQQTADLLRHLADNEIDSDYFAVVSECESYGKETDAELSITEFALRAAGYVDALVEAVEKAQAKIIELQRKYEIDPRTHEIIDLEERVAELESEIEKWKQEAEAWEQVAEKQLATAIELESRTVKLPKLKMLEDYLAEVAIEERKQILVGVKLEFHRALAAAGIKV